MQLEFVIVSETPFPFLIAIQAAVKFAVTFAAVIVRVLVGN